MKKVLSMFVVLLMSTMMWGATSSVPDNAPDVMLQAFYWDSYPNGSGSAYGNTGWSTLLGQVDELGEYFDLVWLPPVAGGAGTGYHPKQYSNLYSAWGSESQLRELITKLKAKGTRTVADIVINHIEGSSSWCSFATMDFGTYGKFYPQASWICNTDEMNKNDNAGSCKGLATGADDDGYGDEANYSEARDWDHKSSNVQAMFRAYLKWLKNDVGFDGWRYDYGKGFHHSHINDYNSAAGAYMAVVEYWDGNSGVIRSRLEDANWNEMAFDFGTKYDALNNGICSFDYSKCKGAGLLGAGLSKHAVTFVDNHDTFTRNDSEFGGQNNSMSSNLKDRLLQANAYILSMPGIPCVFYPHWVTYKSEIKAMIEARHLVGVHSQSEVKDESAEQGGYQATIVGKNGWLILQLGNKVGGSFDGFSKKAYGNGYAIWVKTNTVSEFYLTGNAALVGDKAWKADAIKVTGNTYTFSNLAAGKDYQLKVTVDGTWNTAKGFSDLTTTADGLSGDGDGNICFSLSEAGDVTVTYTGAVFKLEGKFATSGSGSGDDPQPATKYYMKNNWNGGKDWSWKEMTAGEKNTFKLENVVFGGTGVNYNTSESDEKAVWVEVADFAGDEIGALDTVTFVLDLSAEKKVKAILLGKYQEGQGGGDDPQPEESYLLIGSDAAIGAWEGKDAVALVNGKATVTLSAGACEFKVVPSDWNWDNALGFAQVDAECSSKGISEGDQGNVKVTLAEAGDMTVEVKAGKLCVTGNFEAGGDDPQPATKYYMKNNWNGGKDWSWKEMTAGEKNTFKLENVVFGGTGVNYNTSESDEKAVWVEVADFAGDEIGALDTVTFVLDLSAETKVKAILLGKYQEGQGGGDDPQPEESYLLIGSDAAIGAWESKDAVALVNGKATVTLSAGACEFKVVPSDWNWENALGFAQVDAECSSKGISEGDQGNVKVTLAEAGDMTVEVKAGKLCVTGNFEAGGDDPQPATKYYMKNNWNGGAEWSWKEMAATENNTFKLENVVFGGTGVNYNTSESDEKAVWVEVADFAGDEIGALDTVTFVLDLSAEKKVKAILLGKYQEGQGGGDDPQPEESYLLIGSDAAIGAWEGKDAVALVNGKATVTLSAGACEFKVVPSDWNWENALGFAQVDAECSSKGISEGDQGNVKVTLAEAGDMTVEVKAGKLCVTGNFEAGGDDPQPATKYYMKNNWNGGKDWSWKEMTAGEKNTFKLENVVFGGTGVNYNTSESDEKAVWVEVADFAGDEIGALDTVTFVLDLSAEKKVKAILLGKYQEGQGGGDDPQPEESYLLIGSDAAIGAWEGKDAVALVNGKATVTLSAGACEFKVVPSDWNWENALGFAQVDAECSSKGISEGDQGNVKVTLAEAGDMTVEVKAGKLCVTGNFEAGGDDPQPATKYFMKNNWNGGKDWSWKEMTAGEKNTFKLENVVFGGTGVNYNTSESDEKAVWVEVADFAGDEIGALDTVTFVLDLSAEKKVKAILLGKYQEGQGGGDDPQPEESYLLIGSDAAIGAWEGKDAVALVNGKATVTLSAGACEFKVVPSDWNWENALGFAQVDAECSSKGISEGDQGNVKVTLAEAGDMTVEVKAGKLCVTGNFEAGGDDPQPATKYYMKNNWNGGKDWSWKEMTAGEKNTFKLENVVFGGTGVNYNTSESDEKAVWVEVADFAGDEIGALDTVTFVLDLSAEKKVKAILLGKYQEGQGGGDDPQPEESYLLIGSDAAIGAWEGKDAVALVNGKATVTLSAGACEFKVVPSDWNWDNALGFAQVDAECSSKGISEGDQGNVKVTLAEAGDMTVEVKAGKLCVTGNFEAGGDDPQPAVTYLLIGSDPAIGGENWDGSKAVALVDGKATVTLSAGACEFKVVPSDWNWDNALGFAQVDAECSSKGISEGDQGNVKVTLAEAGDMTVEVKEGKLCVTGNFEAGGDDPQPAVTYLLIGSDPAIGGENWDGSKAVALVDGKATVTLQAGDCQFKVVPSDWNWDNALGFAQVDAECSSKGVVEGTDNNNIKVTLAEAGDMTVEVKEGKLCVTGNFVAGGDDPQPGETVTVYFVNNVNWATVNAYVWFGEGDAYKQWPGEALTKVAAQSVVARKESSTEQGDEIYSYTFPSKYVNIIFNNGTTQTVDLTWNAAKPYFYPDGTEGSNVKGTWYTKEEIPSGGEPIVTPEDGYYLLGSFNSWTPAAEYLFKVNPDKANEYYLSVTLAVDDQLKVAKVEDGAAKTWYPDGMSNDYVVDAAHAGAKVIYFQPTYNEEWEAFGGYFYITSDTGTGLDNSQSGATYQKVIENGQLFILRDGRMYTPAGQFVR